MYFLNDLCLSDYSSQFSYVKIETPHFSEYVKSITNKTANKILANRKATVRDVVKAVQKT